MPGYNRGFGKLQRMPGLEQKGEELAAETLFKVADTRGRPSARWDPARKRVHPWIFGIHHNVVVSFLRRRRPDIRLDTDFHSASQPEGVATALDAAPDAAVGADEAMQHEALLAVLRECVRELPEQLRLLCELLFDKGMKQKACDRLRRCLRRKGVLEDVLG